MEHFLIWLISGLTIVAVVVRPFQKPEMLWALLGALLLLITGLVTPAEGGRGLLKGTDVYLFLTGMMLLSETAREEKLFDWLAAHATRLSRGSGFRLFGLIYLVGTAVTIFLSNDATAVVLTPAVAAAMRSAKVEKPLPYLYICAFIANAASFVLPISNPANLVVYGAQLPPLLRWLPLYLVPSVISVAVTFFALRAGQKKSIPAVISSRIPVPVLTGSGRVALAGIIFTAVILLVCSGLGMPLGLPTAVSGLLISVIVVAATRKSPLTVLGGVSWSVLPLVGGLFVIVEGLNKTGFSQWLAGWLTAQADRSVTAALWSGGLGAGIVSNVMNNLPVGLFAGSAIRSAAVPDVVRSAILVGVDLGPNLSVSGSLATILWLVALRREKIEVSALAFLKIGITVMIPALLATLAAIWLMGR